MDRDCKAIDYGKPSCKYETGEKPHESEHPRTPSKITYTTAVLSQV